MQPKQLRELVRTNIRSRRRELGLTQAALADAAGLHQPQIAAIEAGSISPGLDSLAKIATALNTSPAAILTSGIFSEVA